MTTTVPARDPRDVAPSLSLRLVGAGLLAATGGIHLDLYLTSYRMVPTIGRLFLLQVVAAFGFSVALIATSPLRSRMLGRLAALAGSLFALGTLCGYLVSLRFGLFGFREVRTTAGIVAGAIEVLAFSVLATHAAKRSGISPRQAGLVIGSITAVAVLLLVLAELGGAPAAMSAMSKPIARSLRR
ncbi:MAG: hypothetical protein ACYDGN_01990 [Acidimicrobiales bacterium]